MTPVLWFAVAVGVACWAGMMFAVRSMVKHALAPFEETETSAK
jgi:hypothetical protein